MVRRCTVISGCIKLVVVFVFACVFVCRVDMCVYWHEMHSWFVECPNHVCVDFGWSIKGAGIILQQWARGSTLILGCMTLVVVCVLHVCSYAELVCACIRMQWCFQAGALMHRLCMFDCACTVCFLMSEGFLCMNSAVMFSDVGKGFFIWIVHLGYVSVGKGFFVWIVHLRYASCV